MDLAARHGIDGDEVGSPTADGIDPATGGRVGRFADGSQAEAEAAIAARRAFDRSARCREEIFGPFVELKHIEQAPGALSLDA